MSSMILSACELIAANQKKIYDLGFNNGKTQAPVIEPIIFTIDGVSYVAPKGMTWNSYINSEWNVGFSVNSKGEILAPGETELILTSNNTVISRLSKISNNNYAISGYIDLGTYKMNTTVFVDEAITQKINLVSADDKFNYYQVEIATADTSGGPYVYYRRDTLNADVGYNGTRKITYIKNQSSKQLVSKKFYHWFNNNYTLYY